MSKFISLRGAGPFASVPLNKLVTNTTSPDDLMGLCLHRQSSPLVQVQEVRMEGSESNKYREHTMFNLSGLGIVLILNPHQFSYSDDYK